MTKIGTLQELDVKPGDIVRAIAWSKNEPFLEYDERRYSSINWDIYAKHPKGYCDMCAVYSNGYTRIDEDMIFIIISRASDTPKLWRDMTDAEKGALLLAAHEGKVIENKNRLSDWIAAKPLWRDSCAYRIKPEPKIDTVSLYGRQDVQWVLERCIYDTHRITFQTIDGTPDCASIKMEKL